jgi:hypothetical protein
VHTDKARHPQKELATSCTAAAAFHLHTADTCSSLSPCLPVLLLTLFQLPLLLLERTSLTIFFWHTATHQIAAW